MIERKIEKPQRVGLYWVALTNDGEPRPGGMLADIDYGLVIEASEESVMQALGYTHSTDTYPNTVHPSLMSRLDLIRSALEEDMKRKADLDPPF